jgi:uncharacterized protein (DUF433 family)
MTDQLLLQRITADPHILTGKPVVKGTRLSVEYILNLLGHGATTEDILQEYDGLVPEDIQACLLFASRTLNPVAVMPLGEAA